MGHNKGLKGVLSFGLCAVLLGCSIYGGDFFGVATGFLFDKLCNSKEINAVLSTNGSFAGDNKAYSISGYGGGGYANAVSNTPTDIETLKKQAQAQYKNYKKSGDIKEQQMGATSKTLVYGVVEVDNKTGESIPVKSYLDKTPSYKKITKDKPCILIYHTHSTEGYEMLDLGWYSNQYVSRTTDKSKNMIRVGDELTKTLEAAGYKVIHDRNIYDESYNGAYSRSRVSVEKYLEQYPEIQITLDVHRDAIHYENGTKLKPTATVNGKKAAQVMIISGCEGNGVEDFGSWKENLVFALDLQKTAQESAQGLMRPLYFCNRKYNMDVTSCSLLLEFGTDANTLEEAVYSAQLIGEALVKMLDKEVDK